MSDRADLPSRPMSVAGPSHRSWWFDEVRLAGRGPALPPVVWLATGTWITILLAYSLLIPLFRAPDELQHVDLVLAARTSPGYDDFDDTYVDPRLAEGAGIVGQPDVFSTGPLAPNARGMTATGNGACHVARQLATKRCAAEAPSVRANGESS